ncbi:hypothetical protein JI435_109830 [Parastagonospora nodorum SN15]|uniref:Heterokaryon incompatibility domain-containing protein n=1 Tax=Phaeosphaeria nodorum (strain SN15 / ATCC MYA-4574 / FGSC 10173) TaxID=321614 RepID=A0A7U2I7J8_PHANO|nr:hypothetical protein JI435_109830 [Parastagonospora nodorum SN15]
MPPSHALSPHVLPLQHCLRSHTHSITMGNNASLCKPCDEVEVTDINLHNMRTEADLQNVIMDLPDKLALFHGSCCQCQDDKTQDQARLCEQCRHLCLKHFIFCDFGRIRDKSSLIICIKISEESSKACDFCGFFVSCVPEPLQWFEGKSGRFLQGVLKFGGVGEHSSPYTFKIIDHAHHMPWTTIHAGLLEQSSLAEEAGQIRLRIQPHLDWYWLQPWLKVCLAKANSGDIEDSPRNDPQDVRVVDVVQDCIVCLPRGAEYLALSYAWGDADDCKDDFQLLHRNVKSLESPGSLKHKKLPLTISDAYEVCRQLNYQYIWIDRLCIIQDEEMEQKSIQLDQMASIYSHATLTIVAASGGDTTHGLPGVTRPRQFDIDLCQVGQSVELCRELPDLETCLEDSTWQTRGWTYQERIASTALLYFTECGLYFEVGTIGTKVQFAEGPVSTKRDSFERRPDFPKLVSLYLTRAQKNPGDIIRAVGGEPVPGAQSGLGSKTDFDKMVSVYSERTLTYPHDILRALSGMLNAFYGKETSFGMPWSAFSRLLLWTTKFNREPLGARETEVFPTWSWISANSAIEYRSTWWPHDPEVHTLAYWCRPTKDFEDGNEIIAWRHISENTAWPGSENAHSAKYITVVIALLEGCIRIKPPGGDRQIERNWSDLSSHRWADVFRGYEDMGLFERIETGSFDVMRCLAVHTQKAAFSLDMVKEWSLKVSLDLTDHGTCVIRGDNNRLAGFIRLDAYATKRLGDVPATGVYFIALSTVSLNDEHRSLYFRTLLEYLIYSTSPEIFGCPCLNSDRANTPIVHNEECPSHADFSSPTEFLYLDALFDWAETLPDHDSRQAVMKHMQHLNYHEIDGSLAYPLEGPPSINVMLIAPSAHVGGKSTIYERLGVGQIALKRWAEASPVFETIVLA